MMVMLFMMMMMLLLILGKMCYTQHHLTLCLRPMGMVLSNGDVSTIEADSDFGSLPIVLTAELLKKVASNMLPMQLSVQPHVAYDPCAF